MGNSVTRARTRRRQDIREVLLDAINQAVPTTFDGWIGGITDAFIAGLAARGLEVAEIGGKQVDDDTAHRTPPADPPRRTTDG